MSVWIAFGLTAAAGMMLYISFVEILPKGADALVQHYGESGSQRVTAACFFGGIAVIALIDNLIPSAENPHEVHSPGWW